MLDAPAFAAPSKRDGVVGAGAPRVVPCESETLRDPCARLLAEAELKRQSVRVGDDEPILTEPS